LSSRAPPSHAAWAGVYHLVVTRVLLVPGRSAPLPQHWQVRWAQAHPEYRWVPRPEGPALDLDARVAALHEAIGESPEPAVLVAHSAGCLTVVQWASVHIGPVRAALLVTPPYLDPDWKPAADDTELPIVVPRARLPFFSIVVASRTDPNAEFERSVEYAEDWGARLVDAGDAGHLNTEAGYGPWPAGEQLLAELVWST
jgi:predicted alpha/beta hydrolase family esterase